MVPIWERALNLAGMLGGAPAEQPVGVIDIGSNSIRLVIYERLSRALTPIYNEKASCALGRGVSDTGRIADVNAALAHEAFERFARVVRRADLSALHVIATSAVREASNGPEFMSRVSSTLGVPGTVLSGEQEAHFAALGVVSGMPGFEGLVGDLGGGSLELAFLKNELDAIGETLGLGAIRLQDLSKDNPKKALKIANEIVGGSQAYADGPPKGVFAAIGGTWRALAKALQNVSDYPLHMIQGYRVDPAELSKLCHTIVAGKLDANGLEGIGNTRRALLPFGTAAMAAIIDQAEFDAVVFSALGVREGYLYGQLGGDQQTVDPLIQAVQLFNAVRSRAPGHADDLVEFTDRFFTVSALAESDQDRTLRRAACYLSDIGWRGHPDYRGEQSVDLVAHSAMTGIDHAGRAFLAEILAVRYMGLRHDSQSQRLMQLVSEDGHKRARLIGALFRVGYYLSGAMQGLLPSIEIVEQEGGVVLRIPQGQMLSAGDKLDGRLKQVAGLMDQSVTFEVVSG